MPVLTTEGRFDTLTTKVNAGSLSLDGGARTVTTTVSADPRRSVWTT
jgi:hypothetical protein